MGASARLELVVELARLATALAATLATAAATTALAAIAATVATLSLAVGLLRTCLLRARPRFASSH